MKLSPSSATDIGRVALCIDPVCSISALRDCRTLLRQQPMPIARKIGRMIDGVEKSIESDDRDLAGSLRRLDDATRYISLVRRSHSGSKALYEQAALLLSALEKPRQIFH